MIPFPTYPLPTSPPLSSPPSPSPPPTPPTTSLSGSPSAWSSLGDAIWNVFDLRLLWDMVCSWWQSLRESVPWPSPSPPPPSRGDVPNGDTPGHGTSRVALNFWFFLFVYYGFYNLVGLLWITKIFNMYSLNWWPPQLGFPVSTSPSTPHPPISRGKGRGTEEGLTATSQPSSSSTACRWAWVPCCTTFCQAPSSPRT